MRQNLKSSVQRDEWDMSRRIKKLLQVEKRSIFTQLFDMFDNRLEHV